MPWTKPDFVEITLNMEVTGYVNTDDGVVVSAQWPVVREEEERASSPTTDH